MCKDKQVGSFRLMLKASDGKMLHSYHAAASHMKLSGKYSHEVINRIFFYPDGKNHKQALSSATWKTNEYLPEGWKCKAVSEKFSNFNLLKRDGTRLTSYVGAARYMDWTVDTQRRRKTEFTSTQMEGTTN